MSALLEVVSWPWLAAAAVIGAGWVVNLFLAWVTLWLSDWTGEPMAKSGLVVSAVAVPIPWAFVAVLGLGLVMTWRSSRKAEPEKSPRELAVELLLEDREQLCVGSPDCQPGGCKDCGPGSQGAKVSQLRPRP